MKYHSLAITFLAAAAFSIGYNEFKDGFQQARQWVSDKIAP